MTDYDDILRYCGDFGRYQILLFVLLCFPYCVLLAFGFIGPIFITLEPPHWCKVPELLSANLSLQTRLDLSIPRLAADKVEAGSGITIESNGTKFSYEGCRRYDVNFTKILASGLTHANPEWDTVSCTDGWEFDFDTMYPTAVSEWNWVCDENWRGPTAQAVFYVGCVAGCIVFAFLSDSIGRYPVVLMTNAVACVAGIATAFSPGFVTFTLFRFVQGTSFDSFFMVFYIIVLEYIPASKRTLVSNIALGLFFSLGSVMTPWIAYAVWEWRTFFWIISVPFGVTLLLWRIIPESARWLLVKGRHQDALKITMKLYKFNNGSNSPVDELKHRFKELEREESSQLKYKYNIIDVVKRPSLRARYMVLLCVTFLIGLCYDGHARNAQYLDTSVFLTYTVTSIADPPAAILLILTLDRIGRRWAEFLSLSLGAVVCLLIPLVPMENVWVRLTLVMIGRLMINMSINVIVQYVLELLPTAVRGQGMSIARVVGFAASIVSPYLVHLSHYNKSLPFIVLGVLSMLCGVLVLFLPETLNQNLPETIEEAESFGKNQGFLHFPCIGKSEEEATVSDVYRPRKSSDSVNMSDMKQCNSVPMDNSTKMEQAK